MEGRMSSIIGLHAPKVPVEVNTESLKEFKTQFETFEATAKKVLSGQQTFLSSSSLKDKTIQELESCDGTLVELSQTINGLYHEDAHFEQINKTLDDLKKESQTSREKIYKEVQHRLKELVDSQSFQSSYDSFNLKQKILEGIPRSYSLNSAVKYLKDCRKLLSVFSTHKLARTNLPILVLIELNNKNPSLLRKILSVGLWFPNNFSAPEKLAPLIDLAGKFPKETLPFFVRIMSHSQDCDITILNPLFAWVNGEVNQRKSHQEVIEFLEKILAVYIFDYSSYEKYLKSSVGSHSYEELYLILKNVSSVKNIVNELDLKPEIPKKPPPGWYSKKTAELIKIMGSRLEKSIQTWINEYKTNSKATLSRKEATDDLMNKEIYISLWKIHYLDVSETEKLDMLNLFNRFPYHAQHVVRLFQYSPRDVRNQLIEILEKKPHLGLEILRLDPIELEFNLNLKDKLEEALGIASIDLMLRMLKWQPLRNRFAAVLTMQSEEIKFYSKIFR